MGWRWGPFFTRSVLRSGPRKHPACVRRLLGRAAPPRPRQMPSFRHAAPGGALLPATRRGGRSAPRPRPEIVAAGSGQPGDIRLSLILGAESLDELLPVRMEQLLPAFLPRRLELGLGDVPIWPAFS